jgi:hypothetical protein
MLILFWMEIPLIAERCQYHYKCRRKPYRALQFHALGMLGRMAFQSAMCRRHWRYFMMIESSGQLPPQPA